MVQLRQALEQGALESRRPTRVESMSDFVSARGDNGESDEEFYDVTTPSKWVYSVTVCTSNQFTGWSSMKLANVLNRRSSCGCIPTCFGDNGIVLTSSS